MQAWFAQDEMSIRPGDAVSLSLSVENLGDHTETYTILPAGLTAAWTTVTRPNITLFGGSRDVVEIVIRPPAINTTSAGPTTAALRVIPQQNPDDSVVAEALLDIQSFDDRRITVLQPVQRARRRATYEFMVENHGNNLASCRLHLIDPTNRVDGRFDPPAVGVAPGSSSLVKLQLKAKGGWFRRSERQLDFEIEGTQQDHQPAIGRAALIQPPTIPGRAIAKALAVAALLAALVLAWFAVVRPELRDAAERAVDERIDDLAEATETSDATPGPAATTAPTTETTAPPNDGASGEAFSTRLVVSPGIGETADASYAVPAGTSFVLTDIVVQNPNGDLGEAVLLRNDEVLYVWDLAVIGNNDFQGRITGVPFAAGDAATLRARCDGTGVTTNNTCEIALLLGGLATPT